MSIQQAVTAAAIAGTILGGPLTPFAGSSSSLIVAAFSPPLSQQQRRSALSTVIKSSAVSESPSVLTDNSDDDNGENNNDESSNNKWWKDFQLKDSTLAPSVINDFPILATSFDADGKLLSNTNSDDMNNKKKRLVYLDSAATSQKPNAVTSALTDYYERANSNVHRGAHALSREATEQYEAARDKVASFINANSRNEIVFTSGATEAINLVVTSLSHTCGQPPKNARELYLTEGDEIIITESEHHSNIVPWQMLAERTGAVLKYVPACSATGGFDLDDAIPEMGGDNDNDVNKENTTGEGKGKKQLLRQLAQVIKGLPNRQKRLDEKNKLLEEEKEKAAKEAEKEASKTKAKSGGGSGGGGGNRKKKGKKKK